VLGDEGAFRKWLSWELDTLHAGLVTQRRLLADLLREEHPSAPARGGTHAFDRRELERLAARLPTEARYALRLPMHLYVSTEVADAVNVQDPAAADALRTLGVTLGRPDERGRAWIGRATGLQVLRDWPTCAQMVYL
jgi:uncharacterized protein (UPF0216 family)